MLSITRNIVVDRNSNRRDNVTGILGSDNFGSCLLQIRCLLHQMCFASVHGFDHPCVGGLRFKRYANEPAPMSLAVPTPWQLRLATATARTTRFTG